MKQKTVLVGVRTVQCHERTPQDIKIFEIETDSAFRFMLCNILVTAVYLISRFLDELPVAAPSFQEMCCFPGSETDARPYLTESITSSK